MIYLHKILPLFIMPIMVVILLIVIGLYRKRNSFIYFAIALLYIPVSYTHLTLPTIYSV